MTKVYVVTVCRNDLPGLELTTESIRSQSYGDLRHVIIDGASIDGTQAYLSTLSPATTEWISEPDRGIYDAMNKGIDRCPEDGWIIFLNAGDRFTDGQVLERLLPLLQGSTDIIFGDVAVRGPAQPRVYRTRPLSHLGMPGCHQSMLVRSSLLKQFHFDTSYRVGADFDFYMRATRRDRHICFFHGVIAEIAPEGFSANHEPVLQQDYARTIAQHRGKLSATRWLLTRKLRRLALRLISHRRP